jgi:hypothetical protein
MNLETNKKGDINVLEKWETPVLLELDASNSEASNFANPFDGDTGPKPS